MPASDPSSASNALIDAKSDGERDFILRKLDNDLFLRTGKQIIDACELQIGFESWKSNLADLWQEVLAIARKHDKHLSAVYLLPRNGTVHVLFVTAGVQFDFDLADELAALNIRIRRLRSMYGEVEASQIPVAELSQFVHAEDIREALRT